MEGWQQNGAGFKSIKIVFSNGDHRIHSEMLPTFKAALQRELNCEIEIIQKFSAGETLNVVMDNVVDLVLIASHYAREDLTRRELTLEIKKLDKTIPVVVLSKGPFPSGAEYVSVDGWYSFPIQPRDIKLISTLLRKVQTAVAS